MDSLGQQQVFGNLAQRVGADGNAINDEQAMHLGFVRGDEDFNQDYLDVSVDKSHVEDMEEQDELLEDEYLGEEQIIIGDQKIANYHPLKGKPIEKIFPYLCCLYPFCVRPCFYSAEKEEKAEMKKESQIMELEFRRDRLKYYIAGGLKGKYKGTGFMFDSKRAQNLLESTVQLDENGIPIEPEVEEGEEAKPEKKEDYPLRSYGLGVYSWIKTLQSLCCVFFLAAIVGVIMCSILARNGHLLKGEEHLTAMQKMATFSLGNIQGAQSLCLNQFFNQKADRAQTLECSKGRISKLLHVGVLGKMPEGDIVRYLDGDNEENPEYFGKSKSAREFGYNFCGDPKWLQDKDDCTSLVDRKQYEKLFYESCFEKKSCEFLVNNDAVSKTSAKEGCATGSNQIYIQYSCQMDAEDTKNNQIVGCTMLIFAMIISSCFYECLSARTDLAGLENKNYDMQTCTAADYTIRINLPNEWYQKFMDKQAEKSMAGRKPGCMIRKLTKVLEMDLDTKAPAIQKSTEQLQEEQEANDAMGLPSTSEVKVAAIYFGTKNRTVVNLLKKRGQLIGNDAEIEKIEEVDLQLNQLFELNKEKINHPVCAFVTFTTQEGKERAMKYYCLLNEDGTPNGDYEALVSDEIVLEVIDAPEPSNLIWENLQTSASQEKFNYGIVIICITVALAISFVIMVFLKRASAMNMFKYPKRMPCDTISSFYKDDLKGFQDSAGLDKISTKSMAGSGYYQCFCQAHTKLTGIMKKDEKNVLCRDFWYDKNYATALNTVVAVIVSVTNIIFRMITEKLVNTIGYDTESMRTSKIMNISFVSAFLNTAIITLLTNANFEFVEFPFYLLPFRLQYTDFNQDWYLILGPVMIQTILIAAFAPLVEVFTVMATRFVKHTLDSGFPCCPRRIGLDELDAEELEDPDICKEEFVRATKKKTVFQYVELYAGPVYQPHIKYSQIMVIIYVTFLFGIILPALWVVSFIGVFVFMVLDVYMLAYVYRKPPLFDAAVDISAVNILKYAPILTFAFGYWALSNPQMFQNIEPEVHFTNKPPNTMHTYLSTKRGADQSHLALICFISWSCIMSYDILYNLVKTCCKSADEEQEEEDAFDEKLPNYWAAIPGDIQMQWYAQELYDRKFLGIKSLSNESLKMIKQTKRDKKNKKFITRGQNYDILQNIYYAHPLQYEMILNREFEADDDMIPDDANTQPEWVLYDSVRVALFSNDCVEAPKDWVKKEGRMMNTNEALLNSKKGKKAAEKNAKKTKTAKKAWTMLPKKTKKEGDAFDEEDV